MYFKLHDACIKMVRRFVVRRRRPVLRKRKRVSHAPVRRNIGKRYGVSGRPRRTTTISYGGALAPRYRGSVRHDGIAVPFSVGTSFLKSAAKQVPGDYLRVILDPENNGPASIPDMTAWPTQLFTWTQEGLLSVNANNVTGLFVDFSSHPQIAAGETAGSTDAAIVYNGGVDIDQWNQIVASYVMLRVISWSIRIDFIGNDTNNQGVIQAARILGLQDKNPIPSAVGGFRNYHDSYFGPIKDGVYTTYRPVDESHYLYGNTAVALGNDFQYGREMIHISGASTTASVAFTVTCHCEAVVKSSATGTALGTGNISESMSSPYVNAVEQGLSMVCAQQFAHTTSSVSAKSNVWFSAVNSCVEGVKHNPLTVLSTTIMK